MRAEILGSGTAGRWGDATPQHGGNSTAKGYDRLCLPVKLCQSSPKLVQRFIEFNQ
ncbi:hypothetical protein Sinme_5076 [Sinorhizobium meliloti AK83]|nr:hypothetical protein Sinme_5076 [Sinorhizobium meliloti AK83]SEJ68885.1 hypothetical protein SAMN04244575_05707 [Sinorhizobium meliloti]